MLNTIIIDDEIIASNRLERLIKKNGLLTVSSIFDNASDALDYCSREKVEVVFCDIEMPLMDGISFGRELLKIKPNAILIYITAYSQYAEKAYENYAFSYLLKPISQEKLSETIDLLLKRFQLIPDKKQDLIHVKVFGENQITFKNQALNFRTKKAEELFYLLFYYGGNSISSDLLVELLWPEIDAATQKKYLYTNVYNCRRVFKEIGKEELIIYKSNGYQVDITKIESDYKELMKIWDPSVINQVDFHKMMKILDIYTGSYLKYEDYIWVSKLRTYLSLQIEAIYEDYINDSSANEWEKDIISRRIKILYDDI